MTYESVTHPYILMKHGITRDTVIDDVDMITLINYQIKLMKPMILMLKKLSQFVISIIIQHLLQMDSKDDW